MPSFYRFFKSFVFMSSFENPLITLSYAKKMNTYFDFLYDQKTVVYFELGYT